MTQNARSTISTGRRCPNCGSRVAQNAETCYFCGHDLTGNSKQKRSITWLDVMLALALLSVAIVWWQFSGQGAGNQPSRFTQAETRPTLPEAVTDPALVGTPQEPLTQPPAAAAPLPTAGAEQPEPGPFMVRHQVQKGETLLALVAKYGVPVEAIQTANGLTGTMIRAGDELFIPIPESIFENGSDSAEITIPTIFNYTVKPGDTLVSIAVHFGANVDAIQKANGIGPNDFIQPGQVLQVPVAGVLPTVLASSEAARAQQSPGSPQVYGTLQLLGPGDGERIPYDEDVMFRWLSVGLLQLNEWYVLHIWPRDGLFELPPPVWTKATSFRLTNQWAPPSDRVVTYGWQISVVRVVTNTNGERSIEATSPPSEVRNFVWFGNSG